MLRIELLQHSMIIAQYCPQVSMTGWSHNDNHLKWGLNDYQLGIKWLSTGNQIWNQTALNWLGLHDQSVGGWPEYQWPNQLIRCILYSHMSGFQLHIPIQTKSTNRSFFCSHHSSFIWYTCIRITNVLAHCYAFGVKILVYYQAQCVI